MSNQAEDAEDVPFGPQPEATIQPAYLQLDRSFWKIKRAIDVVVAIVFALLFLPVVLLIVAPTLFPQRRHTDRILATAHRTTWHAAPAPFGQLVQDIYPETAVALGIPMIRGPIAGALAALRDRSLRAAVATVIAGERMGRNAERAWRCPIAFMSSRIGAMTRRSRPSRSADNSLRQEWGFGRKIRLRLFGKFRPGA